MGIRVGVPVSEAQTDLYSVGLRRAYGSSCKGIQTERCCRKTRNLFSSISSRSFVKWEKFQRDTEKCQLGFRKGSSSQTHGIRFPLLQVLEF